MLSGLLGDMTVRFSRFVYYKRNPLMVREGPLVRSPRPEHGWVSALPLHVEHREMPRPPIHRREAGILQHQAQGHVVAPSNIFFSADGRPHVQVVNEMEQFVIRTITDQRRQHLLHEAVLNAVPFRLASRLQKMVTNGYWMRRAKRTCLSARSRRRVSCHLLK